MPILCALVYFTPYELMPGVIAMSESIIDLLRSDPIDIDALEKGFDAASAGERIEAIRCFRPRDQRRLFDAAFGRPVTTTDMVPDSAAPLAEVIHEGQNTLPAFRSFQKRFCLPSKEYQPDDRRVLWGYNHQSFSGITGPGYFVAYDDPENSELVIDYRELPPEKPEHWPPILDNNARLGRFVYAGMVDRLRRVSDHVTIGRAYKNKPMNAFFTLVRTES